jgi:O-acetylserine/cysteine efflux transporter
VIGYGLTLGVVKFGLLFIAMKVGLAASLSSLVLQMQAFFTVLLAVLVLHEVPKPTQLIGGVIAATGIVAIATSR